MKIIVESDQVKKQILEESKYIHDFLEVIDDKWIGLDSEKAGLLMHLYLNPDLIEVGAKEKSENEKTRST